MQYEILKELQNATLFDSLTWLVFLMPFVGIFAAGFTKRRDPVIRGNKVLRHDVAARIEHWTHGLGTLVLLISGIIMGLRFTPAFVTDGEAAIVWMNVHFVAVCVFLFGSFYYMANTILASKRFKEHLPTRNVIAYTVRHYGRKLGLKELSMPPEDKYFESEKAAYVMAIAATLGVVVTGLFKVAAHVVYLPGGFMNAITWIHDISTAVMVVFFVLHVILAFLAPFAWGTAKSMFTGYVDKHHAEEEHSAWTDKLEKQEMAAKNRGSR